MLPTEEEMKAAETLIEYFFFKKDNMLQLFLNATIPGFIVEDDLESLVPLLTASNPNATIQNKAISQINYLCNNLTLNSGNKCDSGFLWDELSGFCVVAINGTRNYWQANKDCSHLGADLVGFDNNVHVLGIIKLLNTGNNLLRFYPFNFSMNILKQICKTNIINYLGGLVLSPNSNNSFFINAFGNPDEGYSFNGQSAITNLSQFQSISLVNQHLENQFCLKAIGIAN
jgi:hypothetical protein